MSKPEAEAFQNGLLASLTRFLVDGADRFAREVDLYHSTQLSTAE